MTVIVHLVAILAKFILAKVILAKGTLATVTFSKVILAKVPLAKVIYWLKSTYKREGKSRLFLTGLQFSVSLQRRRR